jgi:hypothetical protein
MADLMKQNYLRRAQAIEQQLRALVAEIRMDFPGSSPAQLREQLRNIDSEITVVMGSIEDLMFVAEHDTVASARDLEMVRMHAKADEIIRRKAEAARYRRGLYRDAEDLEMERRQLTNDQIAREFDQAFELGGGRDR